MIQALDDRLHHQLQLFEIEQQTGLIDFRPLQRNAYLVVVAVRILALTAVVAQLVSGGKAVFNSNFVHASSGLSSQREIQELRFSGDLRRSRAVRGLASIVSRWLCAGSWAMRGLPQRTRRTRRKINALSPPCSLCPLWL